jgi:hypothetical protein
MNVGAKFERFLSNIQLTEAQLEDAQSKHERVRDVLKKHYYSSGWTGPTSILIGSYGKGTACRPPTDVDILFIMPSNLFEKYNRPYTNNQSQLLQDVKDVLKVTYPSTTMRADGQVVVVSFSGSFTVEVIPVFRSNNPDTYYTPDTHNGGSWKTTNPAAEKNNITTCNAISAGKATHMIKMSKVWRHVCNVPIKSLAVELVCVEFVKQWEYRDKSTTYYDWMVRDFFPFILARKGGVLAIPGINEYCYIGDAWESRANTALDNAKSACGYEALEGDSNNTNANNYWKKTFGDFFTG